MIRSPRLVAVTAAVLLLLATGCSADTEPGLQPTDPTNGDAGATTADAPAGDPLSFTSADGRVVIRCFPDGFRRMAIFDGVRTERPVTLTGVTTEGPALRIGDTFVTELPPGAVGDGGALDLDARGTQAEDLTGWADREPLEGATLEPGTRYTFVAVGRVLPDRRLSDLLLAWDDGTASGTSPYEYQGRTRSGGCA